MEKDIWKKILDRMPDDELYKLANFCHIKVQGFRQITMDNLKMCKPRLIMEAVKPKMLRKIILYFDTLAEPDDESSDIDFYRYMTVDELVASYQNGIPEYEILAALYSSQDEDRHKKAKEFEGRIKSEEEENDQVEATTLQEEVQYLDESGNQIKELRKIITELEKKVTKSEAKNEELQGKMNSIKDEFEQEKVAWNAEKKKLLKKEESLQKELVEKEEVWQKELMKKDEEKKKELANQLKQLSEVTQEKDQLIEHYQEEIMNKNREISHLNARILQFRQVDEHQKETHSYINHFVSDQPFKHIALIGDPKNRIIENQQRMKFQIFESSQIEGAIEENEFAAFEEVWVLAYKIPSKKQKLVNEHVHCTIKEIYTFQDLKSMVERG